MPSGRVVFIDQARTLAIALMLFGHSMDRFLGEPWRSGEVWQGYQFFRGISSTLFLLVSGMSFVVASFGHLEDYLRWTPRLAGRLRRVALILFLGSLLQLWAPTLAQSIESVDAARWERFVRADILQTIGLGLLLLHLALLAGRTPTGFFRLALALLLAAVAIAPFSYRPDVDATLPVEIAAHANLYHGSRFPLVPYGGFIFTGSLLGCLYLSHRGAGDEWKVMAASAAAGALLITADVALRGSGLLFPDSAAEAAMPGYTFARIGCALLSVSGLYLLGRYRIVLPRIAQTVSKDSLTIYFVHLILVYGSAELFPGLFPTRAGRMSPPEAIAFVVGLSAAMYGLAWSIGRLRASRPILLRRARHTAIVSLLGCFVLLPELSVLPIAAVILASLGAVLAIERLAPAARKSPRA
jgi:surface polysaccharide O-acyltransferase-like enzyme